MFLIILLVAGIITVGFLGFLQHPQFGQKATGARLERMKASPNFKNGVFVNQEFTPSLTEGYSFPKILFDFVFKKNPLASPLEPIPAHEVDFSTLNKEDHLLLWFGHSSYYLQMEGRNYLIDPVFSDNASPLPGSNLAFEGTDIYAPDDFPDIDVLLITHDHYDHLDYKTILKLIPKVSMVVCGLGVGAHLERWGFRAEQIHEHDWNTTISLSAGEKIHILPARHFSGRTFRRNTTLWVSFLIETSQRKIFVGGDSGYGKHFAEIGQQFGSIDLAILENGQYNEAWHAIHTLPEETLQAAKDLNASRVLPVHAAKFSLSRHAWNEPFTEITRHNKVFNLRLITPMIGQVVPLDSMDVQEFSPWWQ